MQPVHQHFIELLKLPYHRRNDEVNHQSDDTQHESHCQENGKGTHLHVHTILYELHHRVKQVSEQPCYEEWQKHAAKKIDNVKHSKHE